MIPLIAIRIAKMKFRLKYRNFKKQKAYLLKSLKRDMDEDQILEDLVLLLLYVYSWKEKIGDELYVTRSWKGYISSSHRAKSVIITEVGLERAKRLKETLLKEMGKSYGSV